MKPFEIVEFLFPWLAIGAFLGCLIISWTIGGALIGAACGFVALVICADISKT